MNDMSFYVYEDVPTRRATVHRGSCRYCNDGAGRQAIRDEAENWRLGPFDTPDDARSARIRASSVLVDCRICMM
jgi:hypothetical protein